MLLNSLVEISHDFLLTKKDTKPTEKKDHNKTEEKEIPILLTQTFAGAPGGLFHLEPRL
jgi:hypothetical protein